MRCTRAVQSGGEVEEKVLVRRDSWERECEVRTTSLGGGGLGGMGGRGSSAGFLTAHDAGESALSIPYLPVHAEEGPG